MCLLVAGARAWTQEPRMGEADTPGPPAAFDEEDAQAWTEDEAEPTPFPGDPTWAPSPEDEAYGDDQLDDVLSHLPSPRSSSRSNHSHR